MRRGPAPRKTKILNLALPAFGYNGPPRIDTGAMERLEPSMQSSTHSNLVAVRAALAAAWGVICALTMAAPILLSHSHRRAASVLYLTFSCICHQIPERSFMISGHSFAVCHRCFGIYLGLFLGSLIGNRFVHRSPQVRRFLVLAAGVPLLLDVILPFAGLWTSSGMSRFFTGLFLGNLISPLLVRGAQEFLNEVSVTGLLPVICISREASHE